MLIDQRGSFRLAFCPFIANGAGNVETLRIAQLKFLRKAW